MSDRTPGQPGAIPPEFAALLSAPIPAVDPEDMQRVWPLFAFLDNQPQGTGATGIDAKWLAQHCSAGADITAICARVGLAKALIMQGLLDQWRDGDTLRPHVFEVLAKCPLAPGAQGFDIEAILTAIKLAG